MPADLAALCMAGALAVSGSLIYSSPLFSKAENLYHVPDSVVHICDAINVPGREVMAAFPLDLVPYVRQYSAFVCMPYGREMTVDRWNYHDPLCDALEQDPVDLEVLVPLSLLYPAGRPKADGRSAGFRLDMVCRDRRLCDLQRFGCRIVESGNSIIPVND